MELRQTRKLREARGWTQRHLALVAGVSERTVQRIEGNLTASAESLMAVAAALDVGARDLTARPQLMYPVDVVTLKALLKHATTVVVSAAPDLVVPPRVIATTQSRLKRGDVKRALDDARARGQRLLASEVPTPKGIAVGVMIAPPDGTYRSIYRVGS